MNDLQVMIPVIDNNGEELIEIIPETIEIKFVTSHYSYYYTARSSDTIGMLKLHYQNAFRIPEQRLIFLCEWRKLENDRSLASYGIQGFAVIRVVVLSHSDVFLLLLVILAFLLVMATLQERQNVYERGRAGEQLYYKLSKFRN
ncbi:unnamed protein product [Caenorhabditis nigoni]